ncbi:MAG: RNA polymerase sigma factor [Defluviitaleaceae bacterium]|nr:RNA polymerase sigma factor [Defluviitaleaceae bacterium]
MIAFTDKSDYELVMAVVDGQQHAFDELLQRYKNLVYSVVLRMVNDREDANDQAQEIFIKLYKNLEKYRPDYKFSTWVIKIATNHVIDFRRRTKNEVLVSHLEDTDHEQSEFAPSPEEAYIAKEQTRQLAEMLQELPEMYRIPIVLYHQQGLSYQEISEIVNEPMSKVKNRIFRARKLLKENLTMKGEASYGV